jgi:hypothetical protein
LEDIEAFRLDHRSLLLAVIDLQKERDGQDGFAGVYGLIEVDAESYVSWPIVLTSPITRALDFIPFF